MSEINLESNYVDCVTRNNFLQLSLKWNCFTSQKHQKIVFHTKFTKSCEWKKSYSGRCLDKDGKPDLKLLVCTYHYKKDLWETISHLRENLIFIWYKFKCIFSDKILQKFIFSDGFWSELSLKFCRNVYIYFEPKDYLNTWKLHIFMKTDTKIISVFKIRLKRFKNNHCKLKIVIFLFKFRFFEVLRISEAL